MVEIFRSGETFPKHLLNMKYQDDPCVCSDKGAATSFCPGYARTSQYVGTATTVSLN